MPMNVVVISLFLGGLALCIRTGVSLLWALAFGLLCFSGQAFRQGFRPREIIALWGRGVRTIGDILKIFVLIGMHSLMVMALLFLCAAQQAHSLRRFHGNQFFIGKPRQNV